MVAPEPGEPLLLYIAATLEAMSMVLATEWPDPHGLHELGSSSADELGSQDPGLVEEPEADAAAGSQSPEAARFRAPTRRKGPGAPWACTNANGHVGPPREGPGHPTSGVLHQRGPPRS
jgi:hypothetical protein